MADTCKIRFLLDEDKQCVRPRGHLGLHRDSTRVRWETTQWGDNESKVEANHG